MTKRKKIIWVIALITVSAIFYYLLTQIGLPWEKIKQFVHQQTIIGPLVFILITILCGIAAPITMMPLIPFAIDLWGWILASVYYFIGWYLGSLVSFLIAKKFGRRIVSKFVSLEKIDNFEKKIPENLETFGLILFRLMCPFDFINYALGLTSLEFKKYAFANFVATIPWVVASVYTFEIIFRIRNFLP